MLEGLGGGGEGDRSRKQEAAAVAVGGFGQQAEQRPAGTEWHAQMQDNQLKYGRQALQDGVVNDRES